MKIASIASGSTGNCIYINEKNTSLIIDAGISMKRIEEGLYKCESCLKDVEGILITHEHIDHIKGVGVISRKHNIPMYGTFETIQGILGTSSLGEVNKELLIPIEADKEFYIKEIKVKPFRISHDAKNPVAYRLESENRSVAVVTDLGKYDDYIISNLEGLDAVLIEANHDVNMLQVGAYPYYIKQRILSEIGHLSNETSGKLLNEILHDEMKNIILGHISRENNYEKLAFETIKSEINISNNKYRSDDFNIITAKYNEVSELIEF